MKTLSTTAFEINTRIVFHYLRHSYLVVPVAPQTWSLYSLLTSRKIPMRGPVPFARICAVNPEKTRDDVSLTDFLTECCNSLYTSAAVRPALRMVNSFDLIPTLSILVWHESDDLPDIEPMLQYQAAPSVGLGGDLLWEAVSPRNFDRFGFLVSFPRHWKNAKLQAPSFAYQDLLNETPDLDQSVETLEEMFRLNVLDALKDAQSKVCRSYLAKAR